MYIHKRTHINTYEICLDSIIVTLNDPSASKTYLILPHLQFWLQCNFPWVIFLEIYPYLLNLILQVFQQKQLQSLPLANPKAEFWFWFLCLIPSFCVNLFALCFFVLRSVQVNWVHAFLIHDFANVLRTREVTVFCFVLYFNFLSC